MKSHPSDKAEYITSPAVQFDEIAFLYDDLMAGVPYREWVQYLSRLLEEHGAAPRTILDLCCGTGNVSLLLAEMGYDVTGVDISPEMIAVARRKALDAGVTVTFAAQDATRLRLGRRFDLVISLFDSLNYIIEAPGLQQAIYRVSEHMEPGGFFIFDMNTELALAIGLFTQNNLGSRAPVIYNWRSSYDPATRICRIHMEFEYRRDAQPRRVEIVHYQRAYDEQEVVDMLHSAGLEVLAVYNAYTLRKATSRSDRVFFVARK